MDSYEWLLWKLWTMAVKSRMVHRWVETDLAATSVWLDTQPRMNRVLNAELNGGETSPPVVNPFLPLVQSGFRITCHG